MAVTKLNLKHTDRELFEMALNCLEEHQHYFNGWDDPRNLSIARYCIVELNDRFNKLEIEEN